ncbi:hypothetical protein [Planctopirus hydrillae]|uniref:hypothetical protein n=1 Tax=Planctopirus hydrillae TaxID=1841610 RepID=UPI001041FCB4|nr:hypothetical protein [Planctopirus hydrillae]
MNSPKIVHRAAGIICSNAVQSAIGRKLTLRHSRTPTKIKDYSVLSLHEIIRWKQTGSATVVTQRHH